jgi:hypothetical protein
MNARHSTTPLFIEDYKTIGQGQGGWREDYQYFSQEAGI